MQWMKVITYIRLSFLKALYNNLKVYEKYSYNVQYLYLFSDFFVIKQNHHNITSIINYKWIPDYNCSSVGVGYNDWTMGVKALVDKAPLQAEAWRHDLINL